MPTFQIIYTYSSLIKALSGRILYSHNICTVDLIFTIYSIPHPLQKKIKIY